MYGTEVVLVLDGVVTVITSSAVATAVWIVVEVVDTVVVTTVVVVTLEGVTVA